MNNHPLMFSILFGLIIVLIIGGVSLSVRLSNESKKSEACFSEKMELQKINQKLESEKNSLVKSNQDLKESVKAQSAQIASLEEKKEHLELEFEKTTQLKNALEERLKDELIKINPAEKESIKK